MINGFEPQLELQRIVSVILIYTSATISTLEGLLTKSKSIVMVDKIREADTKTIDNYLQELKLILSEVYNPVDIWIVIEESSGSKNSSKLSDFVISINHYIKNHTLTVELGKRSDGFIYDDQDRKLIESLVASYESSINQTLTNTINTLELVETNKMKDEFISLASHQLRTPLSIAAITNKLILDGTYGDISNVQKRAIVESQENINRMVLIVNDLLETARINVGSFKLKKQPFDIDRSVNALVKQYKKTSKMKGITIEYRCSSSHIKFNGDKHKLMEVVSNFIDNAIKYSDIGSTIIVSLAQSNEEIVLKVKDRGMGVSKTDQHKLFTKFGRTDLAVSASPEGMGLGLYLAKKVIEGYKGTILFTSELGKGSVFGFRIPSISKLSKTV